MQIQTSRFGTMKVEAAKVLTIPRGIIGFADQHRFALIADPDNLFFSWLQSVDDPELAFLVTDPDLFFRDYTLTIRAETQQELELTDAKDARVMVICNKVGDWLTADLLGPVVLNESNGLAQQIVLTEKKWTIRQPLARLVPEQRLAKAA